MKQFYQFKASLLRKIILGVVVLGFLNCSPASINASRLVQKSIEAHGGWELVNTFKSIHYNKRTSLYTESGALEKTIDQSISHQWNPELTEMVWDAEGDHFFAQKETEQVHFYQNGEQITDSVKLAQAASNLDAALYVFWQPFKLVDPSAKKVYLGKQKILDSIEALTLQLTYSDAPDADQWFYYFHPENFKIRAVKVRHNNRTSLILNDSYETQTGLSLNKTRRSFFLDSLGRIQYLRAAYRYEIDSIVLAQK